MEVTLSDVARAVEAFAPLDLAEPWDRSGLQVGDPTAIVRTVLLGLDPSPAAIEEARRRDAQLLLTHHPLTLVPPDRLDLSAPPASLLARLIRNGISLYAAHTNLDKADGGLNDRLAEILGLEDVVPLGSGEEQVKLVVTAPRGSEESVRRALFEVESHGYTGGCIGGATFGSVDRAGPPRAQRGEKGRMEHARVEITVPRSRLGQVRAAVANAAPSHGGEVDVYPLEGRGKRGGLGRVGRLPRPSRLSEWARDVVRILASPAARLVGDPDTVVERVAVCGGSGESLWQEAREEGAQVLVTGDAKYHTAAAARDGGFALLDVGHGPSERCALDVLGAVLERWAGERGADLVVHRYVEDEPFRRVESRTMTSKTE